MRIGSSTTVSLPVSVEFDLKQVMAEPETPPPLTIAPTLDPFLGRELEEDEDENLSPEYKALAERIFGDNEEKKDELIKELRERILEEGLQIPLRKAMMVKLLRAGNFTIEGSLRVLRNYLEHLVSCPQYFSSALPSLVEDVISEGVVTVLPHRDQHGRRVSVIRASQWQPDRVNVNQLYCLTYMLSEMQAVEPKTQIAGCTIVADASGFGYKHLRSFGLDDARNAANFIQECFPLWFRSIHVINTHYVFYVAYNIIKPFLAQRIKDSIMFHKSLEQLHEHVPKEILPSDFGGDQGEFKWDDCLAKLKEMESFFQEVQTFGKCVENKLPEKEEKKEEKKEGKKGKKKKKEKK